MHAQVFCIYKALCECHSPFFHKRLLLLQVGMLTPSGDIMVVVGEFHRSHTAQT